MGLTGQEERARVHDSMHMGWGRGGGDDGNHGRYITAVAKLMYPCMRSAHVCVCERCVCACVSLCVFRYVCPQDQVIFPGFRSAWKTGVLGYVIALTTALESCR